jgi:hypothetical protein
MGQDGLWCRFSPTLCSERVVAGLIRFDWKSIVGLLDLEVQRDAFPWRFRILQGYLFPAHCILGSGISR